MSRYWGVTCNNLQMKFAFLFLKIVLSTRRLTVKTLKKSRSLQFAEVHDKVRVVGFTYRTKTEPSQTVHTNNNVVCATSKGSDLPAHTRSLIRDFARSFNTLWVFSY